MSASQVIILLVALPLLVLAVAAIASRFREELEHSRRRGDGSPRNWKDLLSLLVPACLGAGVIGFLSMFVFLALGLPATIPVILQAVGLFGGFIGLILVVLT